MSARDANARLAEHQRRKAAERGVTDGGNVRAKAAEAAKARVLLCCTHCGCRMSLARADVKEWLDQPCFECGDGIYKPAKEAQR